MLGIYDDFPEMAHSIARFLYTSSTDNLQAVIIQSFYELNIDHNISRLLEFNNQHITVELELGIADGLTFNYLDNEMLKLCQELLQKQSLSTLDFLCIIRYYVEKNRKRVPLHFDFYMLRFAFYVNEVELRVFHERGTRRYATEDLVKLVTDAINLELGRRRFGQLKKVYFYAV